MKKAIKLLSLILCLVMAFSLVACGGNDTASSKDDDKDASSTASTTSSTESTTASTGSETTSTNTNSTASQPAGGNTDAQISVTAYTVMDNKTEIGYIIYHQGETIIAMGEGMSEYPAEGETFSQEYQDEFKTEAAAAEKELNATFATLEVSADAGELSYLVVYKLNVEGGMDYYLSMTEIPSDIFFNGVTFSQLNKSFVDEGLTATTLQ